MDLKAKHTWVEQDSHNGLSNNKVKFHAEDSWNFFNTSPEFPIYEYNWVTKLKVISDAVQVACDNEMRCCKAWLSLLKPLVQNSYHHGVSDPSVDSISSFSTWLLLEVVWKLCVWYFTLELLRICGNMSILCCTFIRFATQYCNFWLIPWICLANLSSLLQESQFQFCKFIRQARFRIWW